MLMHHILLCLSAVLVTYFSLQFFIKWIAHDVQRVSAVHVFVLCVCSLSRFFTSISCRYPHIIDCNRCIHFHTAWLMCWCWCLNLSSSLVTADENGIYLLLNTQGDQCFCRHHFMCSPFAPVLNCTIWCRLWFGTGQWNTFTKCTMCVRET